MKKPREAIVPLAETVLKRHFGKRPLQGLITASRTFPANKLLNEMDGLREDAAVLFVLTTNRPDSLEAALASRPGRIDQAIEFPLPDENGRRLLVRLYACGLPLDEGVVETMVRRTDKASAAFIKELMRRAAQFYIQNGSDGRLQLADVNAALEDVIYRRVVER